MSETVSNESPVQQSRTPDKVVRHTLIDRLYHWLMAIAFFVLMGTAFLPILGVKFEWIDLHWMSGVLLSVLVLVHIVRAMIWQDWRNMMIWPSDIRDIFRGLAATFSSTAPLPAKPGKYNPLQKLFHLGSAVFVLAIVGTGLTMLLKIDTPFWRRNPYILSNDTWGWIYAAHGLCAMAMITMIIIHVYFALRPDELHLTKSMFRGWITRKEYKDHYDSDQWRA
ncbi:MAG: cytochrome b/b6 domain-containing protein [Beijerinckiaceae bacterium]